MEGDIWVCSPCPVRRRFNPRPRMEGDHGERFWTSTPQMVSIHALAWRATSRVVNYRSGHAVSIHALAWRATRYVVHLGQDVQGFNPRPRMEGDTQAGLAPAFTDRFQSTPSHGGRLQAGIRDPDRDKFQSTPSHGGRPAPSLSVPPFSGVSIHALAWRATGGGASDAR